MFLHRNKPCSCPQTRMTEIASAGYAVWWTFLLLLPVKLFATNLIFLGLHRITGQNGWAVATATTAILQLAGWITGWSLLRWLGCMVGGCLWVFVAAGVCIGAHTWYIVPVNTAFGVYGIMAIKNLYCAVVPLPKYCMSDIYLICLRYQKTKETREEDTV